MRHTVDEAVRGVERTESNQLAARPVRTPLPGEDGGWPLGAKIVARGVEQHFSSGKRGSAGVHALGPFDFTAGEGEFVCVVGPSGCGKSTFLRNVAGLVSPTVGSVGVRSEVSSPVATVFQDYSIYPWKTVEANIRYGLDLAGVRRSKANARAGQWAARLGLADFVKAYPGTLSGGMRQRVAIARALAVEPEVLLMDEPFAALDAQMRLVLQEELLRLWQADRRTVLFVTHSLEEAILLGDRVVVMSARPGRLIAEFQVPLPRPRTPEVRADPEFVRLHEQIWDILRAEVTGAMPGSSSGDRSRS